MISNMLNNLDSLLAKIGILSGILIASLYIMSPTMHLFSIGITIIISCSTYLLLTHKNSFEFHENISREKSIVLNIAFLVLFSLSLIILHISNHRPLSYFSVYSFCVASVAISIYFSNQKKDYIIQYIKIILLSFNIKYSIFNLAGGIPGIDTWVHAAMNDLLSKTGNINCLYGKEMYFPIMHIQVAITQLLTNVSIKDASNFAIIVPFVFASTFIYLLTRNIFNDRGGLYAMLLVSTSDYNTYWGSAPQTTTYGIMLYYLLIYLLIKAYFINSNMKYIGLSIFIIFILILSHAVSSFITLITLFSFVIGLLIYTRIDKNCSVPNLTTLPVLALTSLLQYWFIARYLKGEESFFNTLLLWLYGPISKSAEFLNRPETTQTILATLPPFIERFANTLGFSFFLFFGILGSIYCLSTKYKNKIYFMFIFSLMCLFGITFSFPLFGLRNIIPSRWFAFEYLYLSILSSFSILKILTYMKNNKKKSVFLMIVFISISFFMSASTTSNLDSPIWLKNNTVSTTYSTAEVYGAERVANMNENITTDRLFGSCIVSIYLNKTFNTYTYNQNSSSDGIFLWRSYMEKRPISIFVEFQHRKTDSTIILGQKVHSRLNNNNNKIYDDGDLNAYLFY